MKRLFFMLGFFWVASSLASTQEVQAIRDPFWPVGYSPKPSTPEQTTPVGSATIAVEKKQVPVSISPEEWSVAKTKIPRPTGFFIAEDPVTHVKVDKMVIMRKTFFEGDVICVTNEATAFTWKIDTISFKTGHYKLSPVSAERLPSGNR